MTTQAQLHAAAGTTQTKFSVFAYWDKSGTIFETKVSACNPLHALLVAAHEINTRGNDGDAQMFVSMPGTVSVKAVLEQPHLYVPQADIVGTSVEPERTLEATLRAAAEFLAGFEDDAGQERVPSLLNDLRSHIKRISPDILAVTATCSSS